MAIQVSGTTVIDNSRNITNAGTYNGYTPAPVASPAFTGTPTAPTAAVGTNTTQLATTAFVLANTASYTTQTQATWNTGTSTTESVISPAKLDDKIENKLNMTGSAPMYACRAWVNFNGAGTVAIHASGNVSSITDNGTGDYTINFAAAMPDSNYAVVAIPTRHRADRPNWVYHIQPNDASQFTPYSVRLCGGYVSGTNDGNYNAVVDFPQVSVAIFR